MQDRSFRKPARDAMFWLSFSGPDEARSFAAHDIIGAAGVSFPMILSSPMVSLEGEAFTDPRSNLAIHTLSKARFDCASDGSIVFEKPGGTCLATFGRRGVFLPTSVQDRDVKPGGGDGL